MVHFASVATTPPLIKTTPADFNYSPRNSPARTKSQNLLSAIFLKRQPNLVD
jgi:hypothetical protein